LSTLVPGEPIFHLARRQDWDAHQSQPYTFSTLGRTLADVGFIHCSFRRQVAKTAELIFRGHTDVVVLAIDPDRVGAPIRVENLEGGTDDFPHIYGPLPRDAVVAVTPLESFAGA